MGRAFSKLPQFKNFNKVGLMVEKIFSDSELDRVFGDRLLIDEGTLSKAIGINRVSLWRLRESGRLGHVEIGRRVLYSRIHVKNFLTAVAVSAA